jgi:aryl-alcohol dehydrogenase-like predicted oxidoreductase
MEYRNVGSSGLRVSLVGLGGNNFGGRIGLEETRAVVHKALDLGVTLIDTADVYGNRGGSEECLGQVLGERRKDVILATKFGMPMNEAGTWKGASRRYVMFAVEASLRRLRTDWIDLYQLHQPDSATPIEETLRALDNLVHDGKVRYIGCSNLLAWQVVEAEWTARARGVEAFISCQDEYSLLVRDIERVLLPAIEAYRLGCCPISRWRAGSSPASTGAMRRCRRVRALPAWASSPTAISPRPTGRSSSGSANSALRGATACSSSRSAGWRRGRRSPASSPARRSPSRSSEMSARSAGS